MTGTAGTTGATQQSGALPPGLAYRLLLPEQWVKLPANPLAMRAAARRHLEHRFAGLPRDRTAPLRRALEDDLVRLADRASAQYAVDILLLSLELEQRPVSASCVVSLAPFALADSAALTDLAAILADGARSSEVAEAGPHQVVRVVRDEVPPADAPVTALSAEQAEQVADAVRQVIGPDALTAPAPGQSLGRSRLVDYYVPVPDGEATLLLSFATPVVALFDVLTELFDAMVSTLQWTSAGAPWR